MSLERLSRGSNRHSDLYCRNRIQHRHVMNFDDFSDNLNHIHSGANHFRLARNLKGQIMKRTAKTIIAASLVALLAACGGGGSDAQPAASVVNPIKVVVEQSTETPQSKLDDSGKERTFGNTSREILMSAKRPTVYEIVRAYHTMATYVSSSEQRDMTNIEENDLDRLEIWFWLRWGLLQQSGETMTTKERLDKTKQDMLEMHKNFSMREYIGGIMSAVYPAMLVNPDSWAEAVEVYNDMAAKAN